MKEIMVLDCTLRDGGYVNSWQFGKKNIEKILKNLCNARIDIVELGFLSDKESTDENRTIKSNISEFVKMIEKFEDADTDYVVMVNYGEYNEELLVPLFENEKTIGIRVAFHKKDSYGALDYCRKLIDKGFKVYIQPMLTSSYDEYQLKEMLREINEMKPYAAYIVDSFGYIEYPELSKIFDLYDSILDNSIYIGFHTHNNLQMSYQNTVKFIENKKERKVIVDSSVYGMGRGAGNLNTELIIKMLNSIYLNKYADSFLLKIMDEVVFGIYSKNYWGYSIPHYLSAKYKCHPNYASFLSEKETLPVENISEILSELAEDKLFLFDKLYIQNRYLEYMSAYDGNQSSEELIELFKDKVILLIAPGSSINRELERIIDASLRSDVITIFVNFYSEMVNGDYIFISNLKRYNSIVEGNISDQMKIIGTGNLKRKYRPDYSVDYSMLVNEFEYIEDNAMLMAIKMIEILGRKNKILIAGFDGYGPEFWNDYYQEDFAIFKSEKNYKLMNSNIKKYLLENVLLENIEFLTQSKYFQENKG